MTTAQRPNLRISGAMSTPFATPMIPVNGGSCVRRSTRMPTAAPTESSAKMPPVLVMSESAATAADLEPTKSSFTCAMTTELYGVNSHLVTVGTQNTSGSALRDSPPSMKSSTALGHGMSMPAISCTIAALKIG